MDHLIWMDISKSFAQSRSVLGWARSSTCATYSTSLGITKTRRSCFSRTQSHQKLVPVLKKIMHADRDAAGLLCKSTGVTDLHQVSLWKQVSLHEKKEIRYIVQKE